MGEVDLNIASTILFILASPFILASGAAFSVALLVSSSMESAGNLLMGPSKGNEVHDDDSNLYHLLYRCVSEGREAAFMAAMLRYDESHHENDFIVQFLLRVSPLKSTFLHTAVSFGHRKMAMKILHLHYPLLAMKNFEGDTVLHVAAKVGTHKRKNKQAYCDDLEALVSADVYRNYGKGERIDSETYDVPLLRIKNNEGNTALHEALIHGNQLDAKLFIRMDSSVSFKANKEEKSPLYLAAEAGLDEIVKLMIDHGEIVLQNNVRNQGSDYVLTIDSVELDVEGKSPLYAAILGQNIDILDRISRMRLTSNSKDEKGRTPLHCAASTGYLEGVRFLLQKYVSDSHQPDNSGAFPIHYASSKGYVDIVKVFLRHCPDSKELRNSRGENILHIAAKCGRNNLVKYFIKRSEFMMLINQKDDAGNTPLHLATIYRRPAVVSILTWDKRTNLKLLNALGMTALDAAESTLETIASFHGRLTWVALKSAGTQRSQSSHILLRNNGQHALQQLLVSATEQVERNGRDVTPRTEDLIARVLNSSSIELPNKESIKDRVNTLLVVTTLIATVSFGAGFTMPGGYNNSGPHEGMATLLHKDMFQIFVICNGIAMYSSVVVAVTLLWAQLGDLSLVHTALHFALPLLGIALTMLSLAFMAGVSVVVSSLHWLANVVLIMGGVFLFIVLALFIPLFFPSTSTFRVLRYITYYPFCLAVSASGSHNNVFEED